MPHTRKVKTEFMPKLQFDHENSFLYLAYIDEEEEELTVPLETFVILFCLQYCEIGNVRVRLLQGQDSGGTVVRVGRQDQQLVRQEETPAELLAVRLPAWYLPAQRSCIAGLCAVVRYACRLGTATGAGPHCRDLLGFQAGCLSAPREVSTWTQFCEVDIHRPLEQLQQDGLDCLPPDLSRLEAHLRQPVRMHNIREKMQRAGGLKSEIEGTAEIVVDTDGRKVDPITVYARTQHVFTEGPELLLSDLLLYPVYYLLQTRYDLLRLYPHTAAWYALVGEAVGGGGSTAHTTAARLAGTCQQTSVWETELEPAVVPEESLYKCDPGRRASRGVGQFTRQAGVEAGLAWWAEAGLQSAQQHQLAGAGAELDWAALPSLLHPSAGSLPAARTVRKEGQLASLARPAANLAQPGDILVDFCSGGGHLGLLVAALAPQASVHMVENKEESLARARERGLQAGLDNVWFYQCNLEYYRGAFQLGTSLHACGVATDLVIAKCQAAGAGFVCCPCCYGAVAELPGLSYPRSSLFRRAGLSGPDYLVLAHAADQTEQGAGKREQGILCMDIVDTDRAAAARESGYIVTLSKLQPLDCTPKNNLLIAVKCSE